MERLNNLKAGVRFTESGSIRIMAETAKALGLEDGDAINVHETRHGNVLLYIAAKAAVSMKGRVHRAHKGMHFQANWKDLCRRVGIGGYPIGAVETDGDITGINIITRVRI